MSWMRCLRVAGIVFAVVLQGSAGHCQEPVPPQQSPPSPAPQPGTVSGTGQGACNGSDCYPGSYGAGPDPTCCNKHPRFYCPARYWTPALARAYDWACGPKMPVYPWNRHPEVPPTYYVQKTRCPAIPSWEMVIERPLAPETSRARYILGPR